MAPLAQNLRRRRSTDLSLIFEDSFEVRRNGRQNPPLFLGWIQLRKMSAARAIAFGSLTLRISVFM